MIDSDSTNIIYPLKVNYPTKNVFTKIRRPYKKYNLSEFIWKDILDECLILKELEKDYIKIICKKYGIIEKTLKNSFSAYNVNSTYTTNNKGINNKIFSDEEEKELADDIKINYIDMGKPFDNDRLKLLAIKKFNELDKNNARFTLAMDGVHVLKLNGGGISSVTPNNFKT